MAIARAPFLRTKFGGYYHREVPREDSELTHVGPNTPCGEYFRRFWQPIMLRRRHRGSAGRFNDPGRGVGGFPGPARRRRPAGAALPASRHLARIRAGGRTRYSLLLSRLAVRRGRHHPGDARRAGRQHPEGPAVPRRVPDARGARHRVRLHGPAGADAAVPHLRQHAAARRHAADAGAKVFLSVQLAADPGKHHGSGAHGVPPHHRFGRGVHRPVRRAAGARLPRNPGRLHLHGDAPRRRPRLDAQRLQA